ncbi:MAG: hypothetical protein FRX49_12131 [Trebouxia sp. A1-2]|nr:MAG: hypothetical protein FRX49_12131 [Trebouxia sp. A1-2]
MLATTAKNTRVGAKLGRSHVAQNEASNTQIWNQAEPALMYCQGPAIRCELKLARVTLDTSFYVAREHDHP